MYSIECGVLEENLQKSWEGMKEQNDQRNKKRWCDRDHLTNKIRFSNTMGNKSDFFGGSVIKYKTTNVVILIQKWHRAIK